MTHPIRQPPSTALHGLVTFVPLTWWQRVIRWLS